MPEHVITQQGRYVVRYERFMSTSKDALLDSSHHMKAFEKEYPEIYWKIAMIRICMIDRKPEAFHMQTQPRATLYCTSS